jgi:hypothetical protein
MAKTIRPIDIDEELDFIGTGERRRGSRRANERRRAQLNLSADARQGERRHGKRRRDDRDQVFLGPIWQDEGDS